ncbi:TadE/TadG family type IV pilus assembly protein [Qipengyuania spongiae]|uniref:Pilus assembly protein n=1 Tax=Qipengyuania spongiae TaxID=2909673 RepID=A0ABY5SUT8_9SPHN|nr:TadE/TadG family type IV pilus assembly protein [Qipengyuania spongiae]UVI38325.1 pilus assembly protein [Qipengyuania spongiae]
MKVRRSIGNAFRRIANLGEEGIAFMEFAFLLPIFLMVVLGGLELANLTLTNLKVQRLANLSADLISQNGVGGNQLSEMQIYDILDAMNVSAKPLDMRARGRVILSSVIGTDANNDGTSERQDFVWQRFDGGLLSARPMLGCWSDHGNVVLPSQRRLSPNEVIYHAQVSYAYEPLIGGTVLEWLNVPTLITKSGAYRGRTSSFRSVLVTPGYEAKTDCRR